MKLIYSLLADAVLLLHFAFVAFVLVGLLLIWVGWLWRWQFVRRFWFRIAHLVAIGIVAGEALSGLTCPLTTWEGVLRQRAGQGATYQESFIEHWIQPLMFFDADEQTFTIIYVVLFLAVALSWWVVRPKRRMP